MTDPFIGFSQRMGITIKKDTFQIESMDNDLRNSIWNALTICYWEPFKGESTTEGLKYYDEASRFFRTLWEKFFKQPLDTIPYKYTDALASVRKFFFSATWYQVYDLIEFLPNNFTHRYVRPDFIQLCNKVFEQELSGYRFINRKITPINSKEEVMEIEEALNQPLNTVKEHLNCSLEMLADRKSPDYRNSIKEAISAVEALCIGITGDNNASLGEALKIIEKSGAIELHGALRKAFGNLYGYTSNAEGIRHALLEESTLDFEDAKFMLVSCSAFINYLILKANKAGISLKDD